MIDPTYVDEDGIEHSVRDYIARDTGDAPGSRYGTYADQWMPVAIALVATIEHATGEPTTAEGIDFAVSLVVNDSDDVVSTIVDYGPDAGIDPADVLDQDDIDTYALTVMGDEPHTGHWSTFGTYWCDTCNSPYCELA